MEANKKNSHLIPNFFVQQFASTRPGSKRDSELIYTIKENETTAYIGRSVSPEVIERNFGQITEERILELSASSVAKDYVFCSHCENKLAEYLESKYSCFFFQRRKIPFEVPYFFWLSVIWRATHYDMLNGVRLKNHIDASLQKRLQRYLDAVENNKEIHHLLQKVPFKYRILYSKGYCQNEIGVCYGEFDNRCKILSCFFADIVICVHFRSTNIPNFYHFYGLENNFRDAEVNDGCQEERCSEISVDKMKNAIGLLFDKARDERLRYYQRKVIESWKEIKKCDCFENLPTYPCKDFINYVVYVMHSGWEDGVQINEDMYVSAFKKAFDYFYNNKS